MLKVALVETSETARAVPAWVRKVLADGGIELVVHGCENRADLQAHASDCDVVWIWGSRVLTPDRLDVLMRCGAILRSGSGTDNVPVAEATEHRMLVVNTPGAVAQEVADHAIALLLSIVRQIVAQDRFYARVYGIFAVRTTAGICVVRCWVSSDSGALLSSSLRR